MIFINYRRYDEAYAAALLDDRLSKIFGPSAIFRASRSISAGEDYESAILRAVARSEVMLVVVGPDWTEKFAPDEDDWVRREIAAALGNETPVVPILLSGAQPVSPDSVPADIVRIAKVQYLRFDYRNLDQDVNNIARELAALVPGLRVRQPRLRRSSR